MNEGASYSKPLSLLLCGVGDPRNVLLSIASLPDTFQETVNFVLNDICSCTLARTVLLIYMLSKGELLSNSNQKTNRAFSLKEQQGKRKIQFDRLTLVKSWYISVSHRSVYLLVCNLAFLSCEWFSYDNKSVNLVSSSFFNNKKPGHRPRFSIDSQRLSIRVQTHKRWRERSRNTNTRSLARCLSIDVCCKNKSHLVSYCICAIICNCASSQLGVLLNSIDFRFVIR